MMLNNNNNLKTNTSVHPGTATVACPTDGGEMMMMRGSINDTKKLDSCVVHSHDGKDDSDDTSSVVSSAATTAAYSDGDDKSKRSSSCDSSSSSSSNNSADSSVENKTVATAVSSAASSAVAATTATSSNISFSNNTNALPLLLSPPSLSDKPTTTTTTAQDPAAATKAAVAPPSYALVCVSSPCSDERSVALVRQFHALCGTEFSAEDLESLECWTQRLCAPPAFASYSFVLAVAVADGCVLGGTTVEYYPSANSGLLGYVVCAPQLRGCGVAPKLVAEAEAELARLASVAGAAAQPPYLFIDVVQVRDAPPSDAAFAGTRQKIWSKMSFRPLRGVSLVHPGACAHARYNIAAKVPAHAAYVPLRTAELFLQCYFKSCMHALAFDDTSSPRCFLASGALIHADEDEELPAEYDITMSTLHSNACAHPAASTGELVVCADAEYWL